MTGMLFSPLQIGAVKLRNRIFHGAISTKFVRDGIIRRPFIDYHARIARGGAAVSVTEAMSVSPTSADPTRVAIREPSNREALTEAARLCRDQGCLLVGQLWHNGNARHNGRSKEAAGISDLPDELSRTVARVMDTSELDALVEEYAESAQVLQQCGFAGVELAGAHGFLIHQTLSPRLNDRTDRYGGSRAGRTLLTVSIIEAIRRRCGDGFLIGMKMPCDDGMPGSIDPAEAAAICRVLTATAKPDYFCFSAGSHSNALEMHLPALGEEELGFHRHLSGLRAACADVPIVAVGKILTVEGAETLVDGGAADAVMLARPLVADPEWPAKAASGRQAEIIPCIACNLCWTEINRGRTIACAVNASAARPAIVRRPAASKRICEVVGSGVAAMEAAALLAEAGHEVRLVTRSDRLGGRLALLAPLVRTGELTRYLDHLGARLERTGVTITRALSGAEHAVVVNAAGATMRLPEVIGGTVVTLDEVLRDEDRLAPGGNHALLFDDDHTEGTYIAAVHLARRYRQLTIVTPRATVATDVGVVNAQKVHRRVNELGIAVVPFHRLARFDGDRVVLANVYTGAEMAIGAVELVTCSTPRRQNHIGRQAPRIGDALAPRDLMAAVKDAAEFAAGLAE